MNGGRSIRFSCGSRLLGDDEEIGSERDIRFQIADGNSRQQSLGVRDGPLLERKRRFRKDQRYIAIDASAMRLRIDDQLTFLALDPDDLRVVAQVKIVAENQIERRRP